MPTSRDAATSIIVERFNDDRYARPRYRLRYPVYQTWLKDGYTACSYKYKRDAETRAAELNEPSKVKPYD